MSAAPELQWISQSKSSEQEGGRSIFRCTFCREPTSRQSAIRGGRCNSCSTPSRTSPEKVKVNLSASVTDASTTRHCFTHHMHAYIVANFVSTFLTLNQRSLCLFPATTWSTQSKCAEVADPEAECASKRSTFAIKCSSFDVCASWH